MATPLVLFGIAIYTDPAPALRDLDLASGLRSVDKDMWNAIYNKMLIKENKWVRIKFKITNVQQS